MQSAYHKPSTKSVLDIYFLLVQSSWYVVLLLWGICVIREMYVCNTWFVVVTGIPCCQGKAPAKRWPDGEPSSVDGWRGHFPMGMAGWGPQCVVSTRWSLLADSEPSIMRRISTCAGDTVTTLELSTSPPPPARGLFLPAYLMSEKSEAWPGDMREASFLL